MSEPALELDRFSISLGGREILRDITFSIAPGERVAIIGPNGAGKTTLLRSLNRILRGGRGSIRVAGRPLDSYRQFELARRIGYVPQAEGRSSPFTVRESVEMARYPHLGPLAPVRREDVTAVDRALEATGIQSLSDRSLDTLSGGERQKALLAAAFAQETDILLLDEPTAFLDPSQQTEILAVLARVHKERTATILTVTHDLNEAVAHSQRVIGLRDGAVVFDGTSSALAQADPLQRIYQHDFVIGTHPRTGRPVLFAE